MNLDTWQKRETADAARDCTQRALFDEIMTPVGGLNVQLRFTDTDMEPILLPAVPTGQAKRQHLERQGKK